jgi:hypothetical protein
MTKPTEKFGLRQGQELTTEPCASEVAVESSATIIYGGVSLRIEVIRTDQDQRRGEVALRVMTPPHRYGKRDEVAGWPRGRPQRLCPSAFGIDQRSGAECVIFGS